MVKGPALAVVWERSFSTAASVLRFSPWACGCGLVDVRKIWDRGAMYLVCGTTGQGADGTLYGAGGLVEIALSGGGLVLVGRHDCGLSRSEVSLQEGQWWVEMCEIQELCGAQVGRR